MQQKNQSQNKDLQNTKQNNQKSNKTRKYNDKTREKKLLHTWAYYKDRFW